MNGVWTIFWVWRIESLGGREYDEMGIDINTKRDVTLRKCILTGEVYT